jgi:hypothetical protein
MTPQKRQLTEELKAQHQRIETMARMVHDTKGEEREQAFTALRRFLAAHEAVEQAVMHATFRAKDWEDHSVAHRIREEEATAEALSGLEDLATAGDDFLAAFDSFAADVHHHAEQEEHDELPGFLRRITDDDADEIVAALRQVDSIASTEAMAAGSGAARFADMLQTARTEFESRQRAVTRS